mmetsp:Transcript_37031/g.47216  ORF Transcript_37031/g.47216 Transcript_37031/m.47216 type:complete len:135 (+) Transcript_37031:133-537(+)
MYIVQRIKKKILETKKIPGATPKGISLHCLNLLTHDGITNLIADTSRCVKTGSSKKQRNHHDRSTYQPTTSSRPTSQNSGERSILEIKSGIFGSDSLYQTNMHSGSSQRPWLLRGGCVGKEGRPKKPAIWLMRF